MNKRRGRRLRKREKSIKEAVYKQIRLLFMSGDTDYMGNTFAEKYNQGFVYRFDDGHRLLWNDKWFSMKDIDAALNNINTHYAHGQHGGGSDEDLEEVQEDGQGEDSYQPFPEHDDSNGDQW